MWKEKDMSSIETSPETIDVVHHSADSIIVTGSWWIKILPGWRCGNKVEMPIFLENPPRELGVMINHWNMGITPMYPNDWKTPSLVWVKAHCYECAEKMYDGFSELDAWNRVHDPECKTWDTSF
jgi:hypothetical protein